VPKTADKAGVELTGVFHRAGKYGRGPWVAILRKRAEGTTLVRYMEIPTTDEATTKDEAGNLAKSLKWSW
jgi:hypothetical protein